MPVCCICREGYVDRSFHNPPESCECGANWNGEGAEPGEILTKRNEYLNSLEETDAEEEN